MKTPAIYDGFIGIWVLDPASCNYQQGEAPQAGEYTIRERDGELEFTIDWTDADGEQQRVQFTGTPDGQPRPFSGGDLADALSVEAVSNRELTSSAFWKGTARMIAQRQLDETGSAMRVTQVIRFPDGSTLANVGIYRRAVSN